MTNWQRFLRLLHRTGFAERYYALSQQFKPAGKAQFQTASQALKQAFQQALNDTGLTFRYFRREDFYRHQHVDPRCEILLHASLLKSNSLELFLYVQFAGEHMLGWNFPTLTKQSLALCEPERKLDPPAGYLAFGGDEDRLRAAVKEGVGLFISVRDAILAETDWQVNLSSGDKA